MIFLFIPLLFSVVYPRISRIMSGGVSNSRPAQVYQVGVDLLWEDDSFIGWESEENIGWE